MDKTPFMDVFRYQGDKTGVNPDLWDEAFVNGEKILRDNWSYVKTLARLLNVNKNRAIHQAEVLDLCNILQTPREDSPILDWWSRGEQGFKFWGAKPVTAEDEKRYAALVGG